MAVSKTEMLEGLDKIDYEIIDVLHSWVNKESDNLDSFIDDPSGHVNYNPYIVFDYTKLTDRVNMLIYIRDMLYVVSEYKKGNPDYTKSMYEESIDNVHISLVKRLLAWLEKRYSDMSKFVNTGGNAEDTQPNDEYEGMFTFNYEKFKAEYDMYANAIEGAKTIAQYKQEIIDASTTVESTGSSEEELLTTEEPPLAE